MWPSISHRPKHSNFVECPKPNAANESPKRVVFDLVTKTELTTLLGEFPSVVFKLKPLRFPLVEKPLQNTGDKRHQNHISQPSAYDPIKVKGLCRFKGRLQPMTCYHAELSCRQRPGSSFLLIQTIAEQSKSSYFGRNGQMKSGDT